MITECDAVQKIWDQCVSIDWENQVRFESQQNGNRYAQNEILRKNLGGG